jgi:hypothetical protein
MGFDSIDAVADRDGTLRITGFKEGRSGRLGERKTYGPVTIEPAEISRLSNSGKEALLDFLMAKLDELAAEALAAEALPDVPDPYYPRHAQA